VYKRYRERPQRAVLIWGFDVSKQILGAVVIHTLNVMCSYVFGTDVEGDTNPCVWYFLNIFIDCTLGIGILWLILRALNKVAVALDIKGIKSGEYGDPPFREQLHRWFKQLVLFLLGLSSMKLVVLIIFRICPWLFDFGEWAIGWTKGNYHLQVFFVMLIFPLTMNIIQFWIVDTILKKKIYTEIRLEKDDDEDGPDTLDDDEAGPSDLEAGSRRPLLSPLIQARQALFEVNDEASPTDEEELRNYEPDEVERRQ
jgi:hypothetical protein